MSEQTEQKDQEEKKTIQEELDDITRPKDTKVNEKMEPLKEKQKKITIDNGKDEVKKVLSKADQLLEKYGSIIEKEKDHSKIDDDPSAKGDKLEKGLGLENYTVTDKQIQQDTINYQKRRLAYFRLESKKDWHKIPIFQGWDEFGIAEYKLIAYRFHDYPDEIAEVVDKIRADYEDLTKQRQAFDILKIFRDENARTVSTRAAEAKHKWIQVGAKFILHMKDKDVPLAHKDYLLLVIDSSMYKQEAFVPNLPIESDDTSAEEESIPEPSPGQSATR